jgi:hypothetical protein
VSTLDDWIADAAHTLGLPAESLPLDLRDALLDATREVAHGVARVAGPLTTYLVGLAVGAGMPPSTAVEHVADLARGRSGTDAAATTPPEQPGSSGQPASSEVTG